MKVNPEYIEKAEEERWLAMIRRKEEAAELKKKNEFVKRPKKCPNCGRGLYVSGVGNKEWCPKCRLQDHNNSKESFQVEFHID